MEKFVDASNLVLGRMCTYLAKRLLLGDNIKVVNCENAFVIGDKNMLVKEYNETRARGQPTKGVFFPRRPDLFVKRTVRGMLPYKQERGKTALSRLVCFIGIPEELQSKKLETVEEAAKKLVGDGIRVKELCHLLGGKI